MGCNQISDFCRPSWTTHLAGMSGLLDACTQRRSRSACDDELIRFCRQYLVYHLVMAKATFNVDRVLRGTKEMAPKFLADISTCRNDDLGLVKPSESSSTSGNFHKLHPNVPRELESGFDDQAQRLLQSDSFNQLDYIEAHQGFSNSLLILIDSISDLPDHASGSKSHMSAIQIEVQKIENALDTLVQRPPDSLLANASVYGFVNFTELDDAVHDNAAVDRRLQMVTATAEAHRLGALLFLDEICATHFPNVDLRCRQSRKISIERVFTLASTIYSTGFITAAFPLWPIFVAGCMVTTDEERVTVLEIFDNYQCRIQFGVSSLLAAVVG